MRSSAAGLAKKNMQSPKPETTPGSTHLSALPQNWIEEIEESLGRKPASSELERLIPILIEKKQTPRLGSQTDGFLILKNENEGNPERPSLPPHNLKKINVPKNLKEPARKLLSAPGVLAKLKSQCLGNGNTAISKNGQPDTAGPEVSFTALTDSNLKYFQADNYRGTAISLSMIVRELVCKGALPYAASFSFEHLSLENRMSQAINRAINGFEDACLKMGLPVFGGDLNFTAKPILPHEEEGSIPAPILGIIGLWEKAEHQTFLTFQNQGDLIYMLGNAHNDLESSAYLETVLGLKMFRCPKFDPQEEHEIHGHIRNLILEKIIASANSVSEGGLFTNLLESAFASGLGFQIETVETFRSDGFLFGESQSRAVITLPKIHEDELQNYLVTNNVSFTKLGEVIEKHAVINDENFGSINDWKTIVDSSK